MSRLTSLAIAAALTLIGPAPVSAADAVHVYGPGGSIPDIKEAAAANLVQPSYLGHITGIQDLMKPGHRVLVVNGAGQNGLWEDIVGRTGDIGIARAFRSNVVTLTCNSALARQARTTDTSLEAWVIWTIWQVSNPTLADQVAIEPDYQFYRDTDVALTWNGAQSADAKALAAYLESPETARVSAKWG